MQTAAFPNGPLQAMPYFGRKRRKAREAASPSEFRAGG